MRPGFVKVIKARDRKRMRWKNGGGETIEIAVSPDGASLHDFDWRVSMARVEVDGLFSKFPGVDRTLAILSGGGMRLTIFRRPPIDATLATQPLSFDAGTETEARLIAGPVTDLNLMSRRGRFSHRMTRMAFDTSSLIAVSTTETILLAWDLGLVVETGADLMRLDPGDALHGARDSLNLAGDCHPAMRCISARSLRCGQRVGRSPRALRGEPSGTFRGRSHFVHRPGLFSDLGAKRRTFFRWPRADLSAIRIDRINNAGIAQLTYLQSGFLAMRRWGRPFPT